MSGNAKSDTMRARSRSSLMRSRCARVRTAATSLTDFSHDLQIRVLEARHVRAHERERRIDRLERGVRMTRVDMHAERAATVTAELEAGELLAQPPAVLRIGFRSSAAMPSSAARPCTCSRYAAGIRPYVGA